MDVRDFLCYPQPRPPHSHPSSTHVEMPSNAPLVRCDTGLANLMSETFSLSTPIDQPTMPFGDHAASSVYAPDDLAAEKNPAHEHARECSAFDDGQVGHGPEVEGPIFIFGQEYRPYDFKPVTPKLPTRDAVVKSVNPSMLHEPLKLHPGWHPEYLAALWAMPDERYEDKRGKFVEGAARGDNLPAPTWVSYIEQDAALQGSFEMLLTHVPCPNQECTYAIPLSAGRVEEHYVRYHSDQFPYETAVLALPKKIKQKYHFRLPCIYQMMTGEGECGDRTWDKYGRHDLEMHFGLKQMKYRCIAHDEEFEVREGPRSALSKHRLCRRGAPHDEPVKVKQQDAPKATQSKKTKTDNTHTKKASKKRKLNNGGNAIAGPSRGVDTSDGPKKPKKRARRA